LTVLATGHSSNTLGHVEVIAMPKGKSPGPSVKKPDTYEALRDKGMSKERAAKISNAQAGKEQKSSGGKSGKKK
jgi:hypothetical protein